MANKHIIVRHNPKVIAAGLINLVKDVDSGLLRFGPYLAPNKMFEQWADLQIGKDLKNVAGIIKRISDEKDTKTVSIVNMTNYVSARNESVEVAQELNDSWNRLLSDQEVVRYTTDSATFASFIEFLKLYLVNIKVGEFRDSFQRGQVDRMLAVLSDIITTSQKINPDSKIESLKEDEAYDLIVNTNYTAERKFEIDCPPLDQAIGGFSRQTLSIFVAPSGAGKTAFCHHLIRCAIAQRIPVYVACVEDRKRSFVQKIMSALTGIPHDRIKDPKKNFTPEELAKFKEAQKQLSQYVKVDFVYGQPVSVIHKMSLDYDNECASKNKERPLINIIDYTGHISGFSAGDKGYEKLRNAYAERKNFALEHGKICFDFAQVNREGTKNVNNPNLATKGDQVAVNDTVLENTDLAGSYDLAQVCDNIITINRSPQDRNDHKARLHVAKCRDGVVGVTVKVSTDFSRTRFNTKEYEIVNNGGLRFDLRKNTTETPT